MTILASVACSLTVGCSVTATETRAPVVPAPAAADTSDRAAADDRTAADDLAAVTARDIDAIDAWVRAFYPAVVDPWNPGFAERWARAVEQARVRAKEVTDGAGWRMTIDALITSVRDGHVYLRPSDATPTPARAPEWTGHVVELVGDRYVLRALGERKELDGGALVSCDGVPIDAFAEATLDLYHGDWTILAQRRRAAPLLLVDVGNPFVARPRQCDVDVSGEARTWDLEWSRIGREQLAEIIVRHQGVKRDQRDRVTLELGADGGAWITLGNLTDERGYAALERTLREKLTKVRRAPYVVWDLRGNGGGNSALGVALVALVWGSDPPLRTQTRPKQWRASAEVVELLQASRTESLEQGRDALVAFLDAILPQLEQAVRDGTPLYAEAMEAMPAKPDETGQHPPTKRRRARLRGPSYVLTDGGCFSSCIMVVNTLRDMGATQVGLPTDRNTIYGESWFKRELPSGHGTLTLPLAIFGEDPEHLGGGPPDLPWTGAPTDEEGLRGFIAEAATGRAKTPGPP